MNKHSNQKAKDCCAREHDRLVEYLDKCDSSYPDPQDRHRCYRLTARRSGRKAKRCITGV